MSHQELLLLSPYLTIALGAIAVLLAGVLPIADNQKLAYRLALGVLGLAFVLCLALWGHAGTLMDGGLRIDSTTLSFAALSCAGSFAALILAGHYPALQGEVSEAYSGLVLFATLGMLILVSSTDLLAAFLGLELVAVPLFALVAWQPHRRGAIEGGLKYAILSGVAAAFALYGLALIYAGAGTLELSQLSPGLARPNASSILVVAGVIVLMVGIGFELALVPFHMWVADVYEGAPLPVTALIGTVAKTSLLVFLVRLLSEMPGTLLDQLTPLLMTLGVLGVLVGNLLALRQQQLMRLLGYSTIAHFGYVLLALSSGNASGYQAALYYGLAYAFMSMAVFAVLSTLPGGDRHTTIGDCKGLAQRHPWMALTMAIGLLSLAGLPPTGGFFAKLFVLTALLHAGHPWLAIVVVLGAAMSFYYYLRVLMPLFRGKRQPSKVTALPIGPSLVAVTSAILTIAVGVGSQFFLAL